MTMIRVSPTVEVRHDILDGLSVCRRCRGAGSVWSWRGWSDFYVGRPYRCPFCDGIGLFRALGDET